MKKINTKICKIALSAMLLGLTAGSAQAAALIYEPFSQTAGDLNGQAGGTGLSGNWSRNSTVTVVESPTLSYGDLQNTGGQVNLPSSSGVDAWVATTTVLGDNNLLTNSATLWFSFMFRPTGSGGSTNEKGGFGFGTERLDGYYNGLNMINSGNGVGCSVNAYTLEAATWSGGGNASMTGSLPLPQNTSTLIVGKIEWGTLDTDDERITMYTPSTTNLVTLGTSISRTVAGFDQSVLDTVSFTARGQEDDQTYDEIRFGATYADVSPQSAPPAPTGTMIIIK